MLIPDFASRNTKVIALSCDPVEKHKAWIEDIKVCVCTYVRARVQLDVGFCFYLQMACQELGMLHWATLWSTLSSFFLQAYSKTEEFSYPIISDPDRSISIQLGMIDPVEKDAAGLPLTCRAVSLSGVALACSQNSIVIAFQNSIVIGRTALWSHRDGSLAWQMGGLYNSALGDSIISVQCQTPLFPS